MSVDKAKELVGRLHQDAEFRARIEAVPREERRAIIVEEGYGDVTMTHVAGALPRSEGGELTEEEFAEVAGGGGGTYATATIASAIGTIAMVAFA